MKKVKYQSNEQTFHHYERFANYLSSLIKKEEAQMNEMTVEMMDLIRVNKSQHKQMKDRGYIILYALISKKEDYIRGLYEERNQVLMQMQDEVEKHEEAFAEKRKKMFRKITAVPFYKEQIKLIKIEQKRAKQEEIQEMKANQNTTEQMQRRENGSFHKRRNSSCFFELKQEQKSTEVMSVSLNKEGRSTLQSNDSSIEIPQEEWFQNF